MELKPTGAKTSRSETVSIRLDPRRRYLAEVAARANQVTLSAFIDLCVAHVLANAMGIPAVHINDPERMSDLLVPKWADKFWHPDELHRFVMLASERFDLLQDAEPIMWMHITKDQRFWKGKERTVRNCDFDLLRSEWTSLCEKLDSEQSRNLREEMRAAHQNARRTK
jgi:hypothetical protein